MIKSLASQVYALLLFYGGNFYVFIVKNKNNEIKNRNFWQIKEMAERVPQKQVEQMKIDSNGPSNGNIVTNKASPKSESGGSSSAPLSNGAEAQVRKSERTIQDENGVYITLASLQNGVNELKRVRFRYFCMILCHKLFKIRMINIYLVLYSRKQFTEEQAEKWWAENGTRVCEQHNIRTT